jgi:hypothetical protein
MARTARRQVPCRVAAALAVSVTAVLVASRGGEVAVGWALRLAREGSPGERRAAIEKLAHLGNAGARALIALSLDRTPVPLAPGAGQYAMLLPRDTVGDLALDELRLLRLGSFAPRTFEWNVQSGMSFRVALELWRQEERNAAVEWLETKRGAVGTGAEGGAR